MTTNVQRRDYTPPPPLDEGYWAALLREGEFAEPVPQEQVLHEDTAPADEPPDEVYQQQAAPTEQSDWAEIQRIMDNDEVVELAAIGYNRGGLLVEWRSLRGFVPASQLIDFPSTSNDFTRKKLLMSRIGEPLTLRVIELSEEQNRLILSERAARAQPGERADILTRLRSGDTVEGLVTNLCDFGAFVDLGGLEGLIHISELSWG